MLNSLRKGAKSWVAKILIFILAASFGTIFFVADYFTGVGQTSIATVGETVITPQEYNRNFERRIAQISQMSRRQISREEARRARLDRQVLDSLISDAALSSHAKELGLDISDQFLREEIEKTPAFQGDDGKFDRVRFDLQLRNANISEQTFFRDQRRGTMRSQLLLALASEPHVPDTMTHYLNRYRNNTRTLRYFILPKTSVKKIAAPDQATKEKFLTANKRLFTAPQYRKVGVLTLSPDLIKKNITVTAEEIKASYGERLAEFSIPGQRHIRRMSFIDPEQAKLAHKDITDGGKFMDVALKYGFKPKGTDLGFIDKKDLFDPEIADRAFSLKQGSISKPIASSLNHVLLQVVAVKPGKVQKKLKDVEEKIRASLLADRAADEIGNLQDKVEDERAAGKALADIAKTLQLEYSITENIDRSARDLSGKILDSFATSPALVETLFKSDIGIESEPVEGSRGAVFWPEVLTITSKRLKTLKEVDASLTSIWKKRQREAQLSRTANDLAKALRNGSKMKKLARKYKARVKTSKPFKREEEHDDIPGPAVNQAFVLPVGGIGVNSLADGKGRVIFEVIKKAVAKTSSPEESKKLAGLLSRSIEGDILTQYYANIKKTYGVTINEKAFARINGTDQQ